MLETFRRRPSQEHPRLTADLLTQALQGDGGLKNILTDPKLLTAERRNANIAQRVDALCRMGANRTSLQILRNYDLSAIAKIRDMRWHPDRCPKAQPEGWDFRHLLPVHLGGKRAQSSSAYIIRPKEHLVANPTKIIDHVERHSRLRSAAFEELAAEEMTILQSLAA